MLSGDCRSWNAASAGASSGRIGRTWTVSPSPSTTLLAHRSAGGDAEPMAAMMARPLRRCGPAVAGVTVGVSAWFLELDLDDRPAARAARDGGDGAASG